MRKRWRRSQYGAGEGASEEEYTDKVAVGEVGAKTT